jgi:hypothetical protein
MYKNQEHLFKRILPQLHAGMSNKNSKIRHQGEIRCDIGDWNFYCKLDIGYPNAYR